MALGESGEYDSGSACGGGRGSVGVVDVAVLGGRGSGGECVGVLVGVVVVVVAVVVGEGEVVMVTHSTRSRGCTLPTV
jgi:hypothetical protein